MPTLKTSPTPHITLPGRITPRAPMLFGILLTLVLAPRAIATSEPPAANPQTCIKLLSQNVLAQAQQEMAAGDARREQMRAANLPMNQYNIRQTPQELVDSATEPEVSARHRATLQKFLIHSPFRLGHGLTNTKTATILTKHLTTIGAQIAQITDTTIREQRRNAVTEAYPVYRLTVIQPTPREWRDRHNNPLGPAVTHQGIHTLLQQLAREGITVFLDTGIMPSLTSANGLNQFSNGHNFIFIGMNSAYVTLLHEATHARLLTAIFESFLHDTPIRSRIEAAQLSLKTQKRTEEQCYAILLDMLTHDPSLNPLLQRIRHYRISPENFLNQLLRRPLNESFLDTFLDQLSVNAENLRQEGLSPSAIDQRILRELPPTLIDRLIQTHVITQASDFLLLIRQGFPTTAIHESVATEAEIRMLRDAVIHPVRDYMVEQTEGTQGQAMQQIRNGSLASPENIGRGTIYGTGRANTAYDHYLWAARYRYENHINSLANIPAAQRTETQNRALLRAYRRRLLIDLRSQQRILARGDTPARTNPPPLPLTVFDENSGIVTVIPVNAAGTPTGPPVHIDLDAVPVTADEVQALGIPE